MATSALFRSWPMKNSSLIYRLDLILLYQFCNKNSNTPIKRLCQIHTSRFSTTACKDSFKFSQLQERPCAIEDLKQKPDPLALAFGQKFTDHMFRVDWDSNNGWSIPKICQIHNFQLHPAAKVLHYAQEAFEGAKAFRGDDDVIRFFRLDQNIDRLLTSARRLSLPEFDGEELRKCIHRLVSIEREWIPSSKNKQLTSLYIRPTYIGVEPSLGVATSRQAILYVLLSPVGPYFKTGFEPVSLFTDPKFVRAWPGGAGDSKLGSNYAPTIALQKRAEKMGLQQVLWLFGDDMKLTEVGTMNIFVCFKDTQLNKGRLQLVTPPLEDGLILPGITRSSIIDIVSEWKDVDVHQRHITINEIKQLINENRLIEVFGSGTACIVCPINLIKFADGETIHIPVSHLDCNNSSKQDSNRNTGITQKILKVITDIQYGRVSHPWMQELK